MKRSLSIAILCLFSCLLLFGNVNQLQASSADSEKLKEAWDTAEEAIETANGKMEEIRVARKGYETEQDTLKGDLPSTILGMIGRGFSATLATLFGSKKGVRIIELDALIMYTWVQADILNVELSRLDAERDLALAAYNKSGSHTANEKNQPDYETIPVVSVPCPNMCGATFTSTDAGGLRNLKDYMETKHRDRCGGTYATPAGCGKGYWTCGGRKEDGTELHKPRTCGKMIKYKTHANSRIYSKKCGAQFRNCTNPKILHNEYLSGTWLEFKTKHAEKEGSSDTTASASLSPSGGSYTASAGSTHTASVSVPSGYQYVYWYIAGPGIDGLGLLKETDSGYGSSTTADFSWSIPSYTSGDHVITAYTYLSDGSIVQPSYTLSVGSGSSTDTTDSTDSTTSTTDSDSSTSSSSPYSLSISDTDYSYYPGSTVTLNLSGSESYSSVTWEVGVPGSTSSSYYTTEYPDGYSSEASTSYTFPTGTTGEYLFRAIVYTAGNGTRYEHTYTVSVY